MAKSMRSKREKRLRAIRREIVEPFYEKKEAAKLAAMEAALAAPKLPVAPTPNADSSMELVSTTAAITTPNNMGILLVFYRLNWMWLIIQYMVFGLDSDDNLGILLVFCKFGFRNP